MPEERMRYEMVIPMPITLYGATDCDDTQNTVAALQQLGIPFHLVNIDHDHEAERFVIFVNKGFRSTPTLVFEAARRKIILTEPDAVELNAALAEAGYR
jgi:mycoredoxin